MDAFAVLTDVLPPDLNAHPSFPADAGFLPNPIDQQIVFRHSGWLSDRRRVYRALYDVYGPNKRVERFAHCGANAWVIRSEDQPDRYAVVSDHCRDRFCRPCAAFRGHTIANNVAAFLGRRQYRFLTLTIKTTDLTLKQAVEKLYRSFACLRRSKLWGQKVLGGCAVCEVKPKTGTTGWHPHFHAIIEGKYIPLKPLRKLWYEITGDSYIVDIAYGTDPEAAARYVSKYITKPFDDGTTREPRRLREAIVALAGRRLVTTFGTWRGERLTVYHPTGTWVKVCPLGVLAHAAQKGHPDAIELLRFLVDHRTYYGLPRSREPPSQESPND